MSSFEAFSGAGAGTAGGLGGRKCGRPLGGLNKAKDPAAMPLVPQRRGRPSGSRNKKTLEALAAVAAAEPFGAGHSTAIVAAPRGVVALAAAVPAAATSVAGLTGTPLEAAAALVGAAMAFRAAPPGLAGPSVGGSSSAAASEAHTRSPRPPFRQQLSYVPKHGFATSVVPLLAGCKERLPLPASFIGTMGKNPPTSLMVEDGSGGQPLYHVEVLHDKEGKSYLTEGWAQFFTNYGLERGWSLILTHLPGRPSSASASSTTLAAPAPTPPGRDRRAPSKPPL
jgi:hypothetical protein